MDTDSEEIEIKMEIEKEEEVCEQLPRTFEMRQRWKEYFELTCTGNPWQYDPTFHILLGTVLKTRSEELSAEEEYIKMRTHFLLIQQPRSGKGQGIYGVMEMLEGFRQANSQKTGKSTPLFERIRDKPTPHNLITTLVDNTEYLRLINRKPMTKDIQEQLKRTPRKIALQGSLNRDDYLAIDEASMMFSPLEDYGLSLSDVLTTATEDPGFTNTRSRSGRDERGENVTFPVNAILHVGSAPTLSINKNIFSNGLIDRFYVRYVRYSQSFADSVQKSQVFNNSEEFKTRRRLLVKDFISKFYAKPYQSKVRIPLKVIEQYSSHYMDWKKQFITNTYHGTRMSYLDAYFSGMIEYSLKAGVQIASIENQKEVSLDHLKYGFWVAKQSFPSFMDLIDDVIGTQTDFRKLQNIDTITSLVGNRKMTQIEILEELDKLVKVRKWDMGRNRNRDFLEEMVEREVLVRDCDRANHNKTYYSICKNPGKKRN